MKKIIEWIIPATDKLKHYYLWSVAFFVMVLGFDLIKEIFNFYISDWWAFGIIVYPSLWKELYHDWYCEKGTPEFKDFLAGIAIASLYMYKTKF